MPQANNLSKWSIGARKMPIFKSLQKGGIITLYPPRKTCLQFSYRSGFSTEFSFSAEQAQLLVCWKYMYFVL